MASCCFTGHRTIPAKDFDLVRRGLEDEIDRLAEEGVEQFYAGGALGFDTLASLTVLMLKRRHQGIRLTLVLPCRDQAEKWESFGWDAKTVDGHDVRELEAALSEKCSKPMAVIANTVKGKGVSFIENDYRWHNARLSREQYEQALAEQEV